MRAFTCEVKPAAIQELIQAFHMTEGDASKGLLSYASMTGVLQPAAAALHGIISTARRDPPRKPADPYEQVQQAANGQPMAHHA